MMLNRLQCLLYLYEIDAPLLAEASAPSDQKTVLLKGAAETILKGKAKRKASTEVDVKDRKKAFRTIIEQQEAAHLVERKEFLHRNFHRGQFVVPHLSIPYLAMDGTLQKSSPVWMLKI